MVVRIMIRALYGELLGYIIDQSSINIIPY